MNVFNDPYAGAPYTSPYSQKPVTTAERSQPYDNAAAAPGGRQAELDRQARAAGYKNFEELRLFMLQRNRQREAQTVDGGAARPAPPTAPAPAQGGGFLGGVLSRVSAALGHH